MLKGLIERRIRLGIIIGSLLLFGALALTASKLPLPRLIYINNTASLPLGIYLAIPGADFRDGDIVAYKVPESIAQIAKSNGWYDNDNNGDGMIFIKRAYGSNTTYEVTTDVLIVDGKTCGSIYHVDNNNNALPSNIGRHRVDKDEFLPLGTSDKSFDGRYTGTVAKSRIISRIVPFLTFR